MDNEIYRVGRDEYVGFMDELKPECRDIEMSHLKNSTIVKVLSKKTGKHLCTRIIPEEDEEQYYIFNMPDNDERQHGRAIRKITLETQEEVQSFFDALSKVMKENKHD